MFGHESDHDANDPESILSQYCPIRRVVLKPRKYISDPNHNWTKVGRNMCDRHVPNL